MIPKFETGLGGENGATKTNLEGTQQTLIDAHHSTGIVKLAAVVGRAEERDQLALGEELVTVFDYLVSSANQIHVVLLEESRDDVGTKSKRDTTVVFAPTRDVLVRI